MSGNGSLRGRIVAAYALLALTVCGCFAVVVFLARGQVEQYLVQHRLALVAQWRLGGGAPGSDAELTPEIAFYRGATLPPGLARLPPGFHEVEDGGRTLDVLVGLTPAGERYAAVDLVSDFERIEHQMMFGLALCIAASALLAALLARFTAGRVIAPVTELAGAVRRGSLADAAPLLARDDEIGVLARAFAERTDELQRYLLREQLFTGDVSHELRTPLAVILGAAEVLQAQVGPLAAIERIERTARNTADRVSALLLLSRAPERLAAPRLDLQSLIEREIERCRPLLAGKPVVLSLHVEAPATVFAQTELAEMAIGNLLRNACQYTEAGRIELTLSATRLVLEDSGPGLPVAVQSQLFERLPSTSERGGSGLGLAIVKRIAEHLAWQVHYEPVSCGGSRFVLAFSDAPTRS